MVKTEFRAVESEHSALRGLGCSCGASFDGNFVPGFGLYVRGTVYCCLVPAIGMPGKPGLAAQ